MGQRLPSAPGDTQDLPDFSDSGVPVVVKLRYSRATGAGQCQHGHMGMGACSIKVYRPEQQQVHVLSHVFCIIPTLKCEE